MKAFVFPGQGAQFVGMGKDLYEKHPIAKQFFEKANEILGFRITDIMFAGTDEELKQTKVTQPAVFLHSVISALCLGDDFAPDMVAGHSLGELSALTAARCLSFEDGLKLVATRAMAMQTAYEAALKNEIEGKERPRGAGKLDTDQFVKYGYVPHKDQGEEPGEAWMFSASHTLECSYSSYAVAQMAKELGEMDDYEKLMRLSKGWEQIYNPETTTGGNALKFYASVRIDIRPGTPIKDGDNILGKQTKVKVVKNKVAPPFRRAEFDIMFGEGISRSGEIIDLGADLGIIKKSGSWYSYNDTKLGQGRDACKQVIQDNPELAEELEGLIFEALKNQE